jgi:putative membrane-bound dehydrogenase-like protein
LDFIFLSGDYRIVRKHRAPFCVLGGLWGFVFNPWREEPGMRLNLVVATGLLIACVANAQEMRPIGVARVDITPDYSVRLCGYAARKTPSEGVEQKLWAKAMAIGGDEELAIIVTVDNTAVGANLVDEVARRLGEKFKLPRERFVLCSSHSHCTPCLNGSLVNMFGYRLPDDQIAAIDRYTKELIEKLEKVCSDAVSDRKAAKLMWGQGEAKFAANRRTKDGPVDQAMPMLAAVDAEGKVRAVLINYACHCTTLGSDMNKTCGDWAGYAQEYFERDNPGAVAMISIGCGADANPWPRGKLDDAKAHGEQIAKEAGRLIGVGLKPIAGKLEAHLKKFELPFDELPTKEKWEELAKREDAIGYNAKVQLEKIEKGERISPTLPYVVQTFHFADELAMVFLAGEVVVDYSLRLKRDFDGKRLWVSSYSNDVPCYIPSRRILGEGGYEAEGAMVYYGRPTRLAPAVEDLIVEAVHEQLPKSFRTDESKAEFPLPYAPADAIGTFKLREGLMIQAVATEPLVASPIAIDWGTDGKLWVLEMFDYPSGMDGKGKPGGRIKVLEDTDGDGKYDKATVFLDGLAYPTGVMAWKRGALVCAAPEIIYAEDTDGDGKADVKKVLFSGFGPENQQWEVNGFSWGLDGWLYGASSIRNDVIKCIQSGREVNIGGRDFRMKPDSGEFEPAAGRTQFGRVRDDFGNWFGNENSMVLWHYPLAEQYLRRNPHVPSPNPRVMVADYPNSGRVYPVSKTLKRFNDPGSVNHVTSGCNPAIYRDELLGKEFYGNAFVCEPVHNLVHRLVLSEKGVTFSGRRAQGEEKSEFLASTDNWFRPVQVRTGPDGALWVVDMYRFVIEHPRWITPERLAQLDIRAGADRGRIYRVYAKDRPPRKAPVVKNLKGQELAWALASPNGTLRDLVHRELLERNDPQTPTVLRQIALGRLFTAENYPAAQVQAMWALFQMGKLSDESDQVMEKCSPQVAKNILELRPDLASEVSGDDAVSEFAMALALGEVKGDEAMKLLSSISLKRISDPWFRAAVLSSAMGRSTKILEVILSAPDSSARTEMICRLIATAGGANDLAELSRAAVAIAPGEKCSSWQLAAGASLLEALDGRGSSVDELAGFGHDVREALGKFNSIFEEGRRVAMNARADEASRVAAIRVLGREKENLEADLKLLGGMLGAQVPPRVQSAALAAMGRTNNGGVVELLIGAWPKASPGVRSQMLDVMMSRPAWAMGLLTAVEQGKIASGEIDANHRDKLSRSENGEIRSRAVALLKANQPTARPGVVEQYREAVLLKGDAGRGGALFAKLCASCHALGGQGNVVGPDLGALTDKSAQAMLIAMLDPNSAVESKYTYYTVDTRDGRNLTGIITEETSASVRILQANAITETVRRVDIREMKSSKTSMMPEGLEMGLRAQDLADLIKYIQSN